MAEPGHPGEHEVAGPRHDPVAAQQEARPGGIEVAGGEGGLDAREPGGIGRIASALPAVTGRCRAIFREPLQRFRDIRRKFRSHPVHVRLPGAAHAARPVRRSGSSRGMLDET